MKTFLDFSALTDVEREAFARGFDAADDVGVDDWDTATPWGCPWEWANGMSVPHGVVSAYELGREWFRQNRAAIREAQAGGELTAEALPELMQKMGSEATEADARRFAAWCAGHDVNPLTCSESTFYEQLDACYRGDAA